jgi:predicted RNA binding protein YcfA (HicA-like mRNA interferase family)
MVVESLMEHGETVPESPAGQVQVTVTPRVAITVWYMPINYGNLHSLTARELISALVRDGFLLDRQAGSHQQSSLRWTPGYAYFSYGRRHIQLKTLKSMREVQARWNEADLKRAKTFKVTTGHLLLARVQFRRSRRVAQHPLHVAGEVALVGKAGLQRYLAYR